jgi:hypothetical protein
LGLLSLATIVPAQHFHLNIGALSQAQNSPLLFQNGGAFATNSGFVMPLTPNASGTFAGYYATASLTPTAIGTGFFDAPAPGTQVRLRFIAVQGPATGSFGVWDVPGFNEEEESTTSLTFSIPVGTTNGTQSILLSQNNAEPGADPFGHIHGRAFSATAPGLYVVTVRGVRQFRQRHSHRPNPFAQRPAPHLLSSRRDHCGYCAGRQPDLPYVRLARRQQLLCASHRHAGKFRVLARPRRTIHRQPAANRD